MTAEEVIRLVLSFIGGGVVAAIGNWVRSDISERKSTQIDHLNNQIRNLYGPLYFLVSENDSYFKLNTKFHDAYQIRYIKEKWSNEEFTQKTIKQEASLTLDIANKYIHLVTENNDKIIDILNKNYAFIDPDDSDVFQRFVVDYTRLKIERDESGKLMTPLEIYMHVGEISFMRPEFTERVKGKFHSKNMDLEMLRLSWRERWAKRKTK